MKPVILLIDDHAETRQLVSITLEENGYEVIAAANGDAGLARAHEITPDLVLLDVMMPERNGYDVCREMRSLPALAQTPIILFTARTQPSEKWAGFEAGASDYLIKPTRPAELLRRVRAQLRQADEARLGRADPEQLRMAGDREDEMDVGAKTIVHRQRLILVIGTRGGSGSTLMAINLAAAMANAQQPTVLVDLDGPQGHIALYLKQEHPGLESWIGHTNDRPSLDRLLLTLNSYWQLLLWNAEPEAEHSLPSTQELQELLTTLLHPERTVVVDMGHALTPATQGLIRQADEIVLCLRPERVALSMGQARLPFLKQRLRAPGRVHCVLMEFDSAATMAPGIVENVLDHGLAAVVPFDATELAQVANNGRYHLDAFPHSATTRQIRRLAERVAVDSRH